MFDCRLNFESYKLYTFGLDVCESETIYHEQTQLLFKFNMIS